MGGRIGLDSRLGQGSRFWFELPLAVGVMPSARSESELAHVTSQPLHILLAEDVEVNRELV